MIFSPEGVTDENPFRLNRCWQRGPADSKTFSDDRWGSVIQWRQE